MNTDEAACKVIRQCLRVPPATRIASIPAVELLAIVGKTIVSCPNCRASNWQGTCDLCGLMSKLLRPSPLPAAGSPEWAWTKAQRWDGRWVHRWTSPFSRFWIVEEVDGFIVDSDGRENYVIVPTLELAEKFAEYMTRDERRE